MSDNNNNTLAIRPVVWAVAGSDNSGGAGIQADNFTFHDFAVHGCNIITAITAQNSTTVAAVVCVAERMLELQWETLQEEYAPAAIKLGMLGNANVVNALVKKLATSTAIVVCDPVLRSTSGKKLIENSHYYQQLLPYIDVLTPNQQEFATLFNVQFSTPQELEQHALRIAAEHQLQLVITGGDSMFGSASAADLCVFEGQLFWLHSPRVATANTHGTGCTLSSAIASALALGHSFPEACVLAKAYINQGLQTDVVFAAAKGPLQHNGFPSRLENLPVVAAGHTAPSVQFPLMDTRKLGIYPVVDSLEWLERCLWESIKTIQLRVKNVEGEALDNMIAEAVAMGKKFKARVFINDYWQLAIKHQAYGVHLGQEDLDTADLQAIAAAGLYLGISTHSWYELARAHSLHPSYIAIGPIFATTTKVMAFAPQGIAQLQQWVSLLGDAYPVVAIGGIDTTNAAEVLATGVGSVAMVRAITEARDYRHAIRELSALVNH